MPLAAYFYFTILTIHIKNECRKMGKERGNSNIPGVFANSICTP